jgi:peptidoglycan/LPS O-acetylase OafA/YrhL
MNKNHSRALTSNSYIVDNADWLKTAAIMLVVIGHFGYFFLREPAWWSVFGRMAAPVFFFLLGYARSRAIPFRWIWLGAILTTLDSWNAGWHWVAPNILFSMALIRLARPQVKALLHRFHWVAFFLITGVLVALLPLADDIVDYGAEGWLWALFGLSQRIYVDGRFRASTNTVSNSHADDLIPGIGLMRLLVCLIAAVVYVWQEQQVFLFTQAQLTVVVAGVSLVSVALCLFVRGPSRIQPPKPIAFSLHFIGWHTLEIYVLQLED